MTAPATLFGSFAPDARDGLRALLDATPAPEALTRSSTSTLALACAESAARDPDPPDPRSLRSFVLAMQLVYRA
jgi:hypothetical protein